MIRGWDRASTLAWRAVALLGHWDTLRELEPPKVERRYVVIDASFPSEDPPLPGGHEGQVLASFRSLDRATAFADDELTAGNLDVMVIDKTSGRRVFPRERIDSSIRPSAPPPEEVVPPDEVASL